MDKYFTEIMPQIRQTGQYVLHNKDKEKMDNINTKITKLQNTITNLKVENNFLESKHCFQPSENGYAYIN